MLFTQASSSALVGFVVFLVCQATAAPSGGSAGLSSSSYGGVVIAGGFDGQLFLYNVETLGMPSQPWLPTNVDFNSLAAIGGALYSCGGYNGTADNDECYVLETGMVNRQWKKNVTLPEVMHGQSAVVIGSHIWFAKNGKVYDLDTWAGRFQLYDTPFESSSTHCAVSNSTHSFMVGVGKTMTEIWMNEEANSASSWKQIHVMSDPRKYFGCLLYQNEIIITGGLTDYHKVQIFDIVKMKMRSGGNLVTGRSQHKMAVLDGKPAVLGGADKNQVSITSIETFDADAEVWNTDSRVLQQARSNPGLAQLTE